MGKEVVNGSPRHAKKEYTYIYIYLSVQSKHVDIYV